MLLLALMLCLPVYEASKNKCLVSHQNKKSQRGREGDVFFFSLRK